MPNSLRPEAVAAPAIGRIVLAGLSYAVHRDFCTLPPHIPKARISQVAVDRADRLHVLRRGSVPVVVFSPQGDYLHAYGEGLIFDAHGISIDHQDRVAIVDRDAHQVLFFTSAGQACGTLGARHRPVWQQPFNHPTRAAVAPDGEIYVADGYGNARVHRFAADGRYRASFGSLGHGPGAFMTPHAVLVDRQDAVLVGDRENDRVQVFDREGLWRASWEGLCRPMDLCETPEGVVLVTDQVPSLTAFGPGGQRLGRARPSLNGAHGIACDSAGHLYLAEIEPNCVTKLWREDKR